MYIEMLPKTVNVVIKKGNPASLIVGFKKPIDLSGMSAKYIYARAYGEKSHEFAADVDAANSKIVVTYTENIVKSLTGVYIHELKLSTGRDVFTGQLMIGNSIKVEY